MADLIAAIAQECLGQARPVVLTKEVRVSTWWPLGEAAQGIRVRDQARALEVRGLNELSGMLAIGKGTAMHSHDSEFEDGLRPKAFSLEPAVEGVPSARLVRAAATGRPDALDSTAVLGLQRVVGNAGVGAALDQDRRDEPSTVQQVVGSGGGSALPDTVRTDMERRLGHDFSDVRVHTDAAAHHLARSVSAHAYTVGSNVVFQRDMYDPSSNSGKTMLAHELTHVVQQRAGAVDGTPAAGGIKVSDPSDRFEREASGPASG